MLVLLPLACFLLLMGMVGEAAPLEASSSLSKAERARMDFGLSSRSNSVARVRW